ncbi:MAG: IPT/TIG domain-containing protein [Deltaproteobacteria bacterium]|nr:IPT/TIG domain-containing protein [Deltaproteobacteria bacterium]
MRAALKVVVLGAWTLVLPGCLQDLVKGFVPIAPGDAEIAFPDGGTGVDADGIVPDRFGLLHVKPAHGPFAGGTKVVITGSGFGKGVTVRIGGKEIQTGQQRIISPIQVEVLTPAGEVGAADVEVTNGKETLTLPGAFTYDGAYLDPASGPSSGGTLVTLYGKGTSFVEGMKLTLGGKPLTEVEVVGTTSLRAVTPPGIDGPVELVFAGADGKDVRIKDAYTYYTAASPLNGGMGGGRIQGTVTVTVLDQFTRQPVKGARVYLQKGRAIAASGDADAKGVVVFAAKEMAGPVTVSAGAPKYETTTVVQFDARDLTVLLTPIIEPQPGPFPPGQRQVYIEGYVLFGGPTGAGSTRWNIIPEPKQGQQKRVYVYVTNSSVRYGPPYAGPTAVIDYEAGTGTTAWPYSLYSRTGSLAVYALAGLHTQATNTFVPYAMGITRGVVGGPGDRLKVDVLVNIPLTEKVTVELADVPQGMLKHRVRFTIDLGADGFILRDDMDRSGDGVPTTFDFSRLPSFSHQGLFDAAYSVDVLFDAGSVQGVPYTRGTAMAVQPTGGKIVVDGFLGVPVQVKPAPGGPLQGNTLKWSYSGGKPSLAVTVLMRPDETPVWRVISPGDVTEVKLPDPRTVGLPEWPAGNLVWLQYLVRLPGFDFNSYNYSHLSSRYWDRWSYDEFAFKVTTP